MWTCSECENINLYEEDPDACNMCLHKKPATLSQPPIEEVKGPTEIS